MEEKPLKSDQDQPAPARRQPAGKTKKKNRAVWLGIVGVAIVVIGLGVGLGVGLTRNKGGSGGDDRDSEPEPGSYNRTSMWRPAVGASWQIVLPTPIQLGDAKAVTPAVDVYDLDLFDNEAATFATLHAAGIRVVCYFSAGSYEEWRADKADFAPADLGKPLDGWPGERWLNISSPGVRAIMRKRIKLAADKGCDAIDPDNVDGYQNDNGLGLTQAEASNYVKFLAGDAASYNMSTGLKNAGDIVDDVMGDVAFSVNEQCVEYSECERFASFIAAGKPVFHIEYPKGAPSGVSVQAANDVCSSAGKAAGSDRFSTVIKDDKLNGWVQYCDGKQFTTPQDD